MAKEELEHVHRPNLPWRQRALTECGLEIDGRPVITREQLSRKWKDQGQQRAALTTCMTCLTTGNRWRGWDESPSEVMARWIDAPHRRGYSDQGPSETDHELIAIAALIEAHREEYDAFLAGLQSTTSLSQHRRLRRSRP